MFGRLRNGTARAIYDFATRRVLDLPALAISDAPLRIVSMVSHRDLRMYLVAARSLYGQLREGRFVIVNDGSLTADDMAILDRQLAGPEIAPISSIDTGPCPRGGTWERLFKIAELTQASYIIQMDSDTLTRSDISEVLGAYRANRSFTLGTNMGQRPVTAEETGQLVARSALTHVQIVFEKNMRHIDVTRDLRYVRGSSGFAGFARGQPFRKHVEEVSGGIEAKLGRKWHEWGSEQVMSNLIVANAHESIVLVGPKYICYQGQPDGLSSSFMHFIGTHRFDRGLYAQESRRFIQQGATG